MAAAKKPQKAKWKRQPDFWNGYVDVRTWVNTKTKEMWQAADHHGGKGGDAIYVKKPFGVAKIKTFSSFRKAIEYVAKKVGCGYPNASRRQS